MSRLCLELFDDNDELKYIICPVGNIEIEMEIYGREAKLLRRALGTPSTNVSEYKIKRIEDTKPFPTSRISEWASEM